MAKEVVPLKGDVLMYAVNRTLLPNLRNLQAAALVQLPLKFLALKLREGKGFVEIDTQPKAV